jgi:hypothetical protein
MGLSTSPDFVAVLTEPLYVIGCATVFLFYKPCTLGRGFVFFVLVIVLVNVTGFVINIVVEGMLHQKCLSLK